MALGTEQDVAELPCGRDPLDVIDRARRGRVNAHMRGCPFCQALMVADLPGGSAAKSMREEVVEAPETLLPAVMSTVWAELRPGRNIPLSTMHGTAFVSERAISSMLEHTLDLIPDFVVHLCRVETQEHADGQGPAAVGGDVDELPAEADPVPPRTTPALAIEVSAAAAYDADLLLLAARARGLAAETLLAQFGLVADAIDINFVDVYQKQDLR